MRDERHVGVWCWKAKILAKAAAGCGLFIRPQQVLEVAAENNDVFGLDSSALTF